MYDKWYRVEWNYRDKNGYYRTGQEDFDTENEVYKKFSELSFKENITDVFKITYERWKIK